MKILSLASLLSLQSPNLLSKFKNDELLVISPLEDEIDANFVKCEIGSISYVLALIAKNLLNNDFFNELDEGFLSGESNVGEEELPNICEFVKNISFCIVSDEILRQKNHEQIAEILNLLSKKFGFEVINLDGKKLSLNGKLKELEELENFDGAVIFTHFKNDEFKGGEYFKIAAKLKNNDEVIVKTPQKDIKTTFYLDKSLKGTVGFLGNKDLQYNFCIAKFIR